MAAVVPWRADRSAVKGSISRIVRLMKYFVGAAMLMLLAMTGCSSGEEAGGSAPISSAVTESAPSVSATTPDPSGSETSDAADVTSSPVPGTEPASPQVLELFDGAQLGNPIEVKEALQLPLTSAVSGTTRYLAVARAVDVAGTDTYVALTIVFTDDGGSSYNRVDAASTEYQNGLTYSGLTPYEGADADNLMTQADGMAVDLGAAPDDSED